MAHAHLDTRDKVLARGHDDRIQLVFYESGEQKTQVVTAAEVEARLAECTQVVLTLLELRKRVEALA